MIPAKNTLIDDMPFSSVARRLLKRAGILNLQELSVFLADRNNLRICGNPVWQEIQEIAGPYLEELALDPQMTSLSEAKRTILGRLLTADETVLIKKISIHTLRIPGGAPNWLRKLDLETVWDLAVLSEYEIKSIPIIGPRKMKEVRVSIERAIRRKGIFPNRETAKPHHLSPSSSLPSTVGISSDPNVIGRTLTWEETQLAKELPIEALVLPQSIVDRLKQDLGLVRVGGLALNPESSIRSLFPAEPAEVERIRFAIEEALQVVPSKRYGTPGSGTEPNILGRWLASEETPLAKELPLEDLRLPRSVLVRLGHVGLATVWDLACAGESAIGSFRYFGQRKLQAVRLAAEEALLSLKEAQEVRYGPKELDRLVDDLIRILEERSRRILRYRYGLSDGKRHTLEEVATRLDLTRERVRQLQKKAEKNLSNMQSRRKLAFYLHNLSEKHVPRFLESSRGFAAEQEIMEGIFGKRPRIIAARHFIDRLFPGAWENLAEGLLQEDGVYFIRADAKEAFAKVLTGIKTQLMAKGRPLRLEELAKTLSRIEGRRVPPSFVKHCVRACKDLKFDTSRNVGLSRWKYTAPRSVREMARRALLELGQSSHFTRIAERMNLMFPERAPFSSNSVHSQIAGRKEIFVRVGQGTYGLADWGITPKPFIKQFLAETLRRNGGEAQIEDLIALGKAKYGYKESSMRMNLSLNPRMFKVFRDGRCRLI